MPIEIDPNTGAPIVSPATNDFTAPTTEPNNTVDSPATVEPVTSDPLHSSLDTSSEGESSNEGTDGTDSTDGNESEEVIEEPKAPPINMDDEQEKQVREVLRYSCSDSQAADKAFVAIQLILRNKFPKE